MNIACLRPNYMQVVTMRDGEKKYVFLGPRSHYNGSDLELEKRDDVIKVPCGQCDECRLQYARVWADRCVMEASLHDENYFVTLTYDDKHVPRADNGALTLEKNAISEFIKSLRDKFPKLRFKFFGCGEYGSETFRPHYHVLLFGFPLSDKQLVRKTELKYDVYKSKIIDEAWNKGITEIGSCTWDSCCYVARYVTKKANGYSKEYYEKLGIVPEYVRMSRRPGIGKEFYEKNFSEIWSYDKMYLPTDDGNIAISPPRYFRKLLAKQSAEVASIISADKAKIAKQRYLSALENTSLLPAEYDDVRADSLKQRTKILKRSM